MPFDVNNPLQPEFDRALRGLQNQIDALKQEIAQLKTAQGATTTAQKQTTPSKPPAVVVGAGSNSHHALTGLAEGDDHPHYLNTARGDARYLTEAEGDARYLLRADGISTVTTTAAITGGGTTGTETFVDGQLTAETPAT